MRDVETKKAIYNKIVRNTRVENDKRDGTETFRRQ